MERGYQHAEFRHRHGARAAEQKLAPMQALGFQRAAATVRAAVGKSVFHVEDARDAIMDML